MNAVLQDRFARHMAEFGGEPDLARAIEWISENIEPSKVFSGEALIKHVAEAYSPHEVFDYSELVESVDLL